MTVADTVLINGKVATVDRHFRFTRAIAVKNGWIINVGEDEEIKTHIGPDTQIIDLQGKLILPAAHDAHVHISWLAASWKCINCSTARTLEALLALLRERAATTPPGQWIHACGFNPAIIDSSRPLTRHDIDSATPNHPAFLAFWDGHSCLVNSNALEIVGITRETQDPIGGFINAIQTCPGPQRRHYVLHGSMGDREDFVKAAKYGIILSEQPSPSGSAYDYERRAQVCGIKGEIGKGLKDIIDLGVTVAGGSDGIMDLVNWRQMVQAAVTRKSASSGKIIRPELAISVADGVRMYTINAAYQEFQEQVRGSIEVGKVADFQVLDRDIFSVPHEDIGNSQVLLTMVDGNIVWQCQEQVLQIRKGG
ncbi:hypothetical protein BKE93_11590 [Salmonella enterica]|nr:hypothetical protein [Salmonella enterica]ECH9696815.1 hypothetical protein [Salmonella enterica subsp. enterica]EEJ9044296.1 amidohydrolase family protein [Salmonella enterica subsp. enterica]